MTSSLEGLNNRFEPTKERISSLGDRPMVIMQPKEQREKKNEEKLTELQRNAGYQ